MMEESMFFILLIPLNITIWIFTISHKVDVDSYIIEKKSECVTR